MREFIAQAPPLYSCMLCPRRFHNGSEALSHVATHERDDVLEAYGGGAGVWYDRALKEVAAGEAARVKCPVDTCTQTLSRGDQLPRHLAAKHDVAELVDAAISPEMMAKVEALKEKKAGRA
jgi:hypothetical protein